MTTADADAQLRRRRKVVAACVVVMVLAVAGVLIVVLVTSGGNDDAPQSPADAATAWGTALVHHDSAALKRLRCPDGGGSADVFALTALGTGVRAGAATPQGRDTWDVPVTTTGPGGGTTVHVKVERHDGKYVVC